MINVCFMGNYSTVRRYTSVGLVWETKPGLTVRYSTFSLSPSLFHSVSVCRTWNGIIAYSPTVQMLWLVVQRRHLDGDQRKSILIS